MGLAGLRGGLGPWRSTSGSQMSSAWPLSPGPHISGRHSGPGARFWMEGEGLALARSCLPLTCPWSAGPYSVSASALLPPAPSLPPTEAPDSPPLPGCRERPKQMGRVPAGPSGPSARILLSRLLLLWMPSFLGGFFKPPALFLPVPLCLIFCFRSIK